MKFVASYSLEVVSEYLYVGSGRLFVPNLTPISDADIENFLQRGVLPVIEGRTFWEFSRSGDKIAIPGSTIKGLVRSRLELSIPEACYVVSSRSKFYSRRYRQIFKPVRKERDEFDPSENPYVCPVCDLLGNAGLASRVNFFDAILVKGEPATRNGFEVVKKGSVFKGRILGFVRDEVEAGMVFYGMGIRVVNNRAEGKVTLLGRFKFSDRSFGRVRFAVEHSNFDVVKALQAFTKKYNPRNIEEDW